MYNNSVGVGQVFAVGLWLQRVGLERVHARSPDAFLETNMHTTHHTGVAKINATLSILTITVMKAMCMMGVMLKMFNVSHVTTEIDP